MQKGFAPVQILVVVLILILVGGGTYYLGKSQTPKPQTQNPVVVSPTLQPTTTPSSTQNTSVLPLPSATSVSKSVNNIEYSLPSGWKKIIDTSGRLEVGYDASKYDAKSKEKLIELSGKWILEGNKSKRLGWNKFFQLAPYNGGSRHDELYKILGENPTLTGSRTKNYSEREYTYNGWKCLVLNGISISDYPVAWGYYPISSTEALVLAFDGFDWSEIEQQIAAVRLLK